MPTVVGEQAARHAWRCVRIGERIGPVHEHRRRTVHTLTVRLVQVRDLPVHQLDVVAADQQRRQLLVEQRHIRAVGHGQHDKLHRTPLRRTPIPILTSTVNLPSQWKVKE